MKKHPLTVLLMCGLLLLNLNCYKSVKTETSPKLVVLIAVDGLGEEMLERYSTVLKGGFKYLDQKGFRYDSAFVDHAITVSHAGHVTLSTGSQPSRHGIVDAAFYEPKDSTRILTDAVADSSERIVGEVDGHGVSPRKILTPGLGEWIKQANPHARTLSIGSGYVSSLLYASTPGDVFWYSRSSGIYVTSSFYRKDLPDWLNQFNNDSLPRYKNASKSWNCSVPSALRSLARKDSSEYEADGIEITFPHIYEKELIKEIPANPNIINTWFAWTPVADAATLALARTGIKAKLLGQRQTTDYLSIVLSQIDNVCHYYGPNSLEAMDALLRLDEELAGFFSFLDTTIGTGNYILALSADHGFPEIPEYRAQHGQYGKRISAEEIEQLMTSIKISIGESSVLSPAVVKKVNVILKKSPFISDVYLPRDLNTNSTTEDTFISLYKNSYRKDRVPRLPLFSLNNFESLIGKCGIMVRLKEGAMINLDVSIHGSPYDYDRHVPLYFVGTGVNPGKSDQPVATTDVAPTLAGLAGITIPHNTDGKSLIKNR